MKKILKWVEGNPFALGIPLEKEIYNGEARRKEDYVPTAGTVVTVTLVGGAGCGNKSYVARIQSGNIARIQDDGTLARGIYDVEVKAVEPDGTRRRSMWTKQVQIVRNNGEVLQQWDEFAEMSGEQLDAAVFFAGERGEKGEKGDKGEKGEKGDRGERGERGQDGRDGRDGVDGAPGRDGVDGTPGRDGVDGQDGRDGVDGAPGQDGQDGKSAYQSYLDTTTDNPKKTEAQWVASLKGEQGDPSSADINLSGSIISVTNNAGVTNTIDVLASTDERVQIAVTTSVQGADVSGLTINAYFNGSDTPTKTATTDANGMAVLTVPNGYQYRLVFPSVQGCKDPTDVVHTASVSQRSVEVEYKAATPADDGENVTVIIQQKSGNGYTKISGATATVTVDGVTTTYTTDAQGKLTFAVPYGKSYTLTAARRDGWYIPQNGYTLSLVAEQLARSVVFEFRSYTSGLTIMDADGNDYTLERWEEMVGAGTADNADAKFIKVSSAALANAGGVFCVDIDMVRERTQGSNTSWAGSNVQFNSIPLNGNSSAQNYYYDGLTASKLIQKEGDDRSISTNAVDRCLAMSRVVAEGTAEEKTMPGFLGSTGQWATLWANVAELDDILRFVRPNGTYLMSAWTTQKWTCTQNNANLAYNWTSVASNSLKSASYVVLPFFAC